jgi:ribosomal protein S18 acetylase RimI-like enzyme
LVGGGTRHRHAIPLTAKRGTVLVGVPRASDGYIWGVYVEAPFRRRGFGKQLTAMAVDYLKSIGCTRVILHASPSGQPIYTSLGFVASNEMRLDLLEND